MVDETQRAKIFARYSIGFLFVALAIVLLGKLTDSSTDVTPGHADLIVDIAAAAAVLAAVIALILIIYFKAPLRGPRFLSVPFAAILAGFMTGLAAFTAADWAVQLVDFHGSVERYEWSFPIARAYVSHGKGVSYHVQLADPFADFTLEREDYMATFGASEELRPVGYCLRATVEQSGAAADHESCRASYCAWTGEAVPYGRFLVQRRTEHRWAVSKFRMMSRTGRGPNGAA
jgi:hypothetical protein